MFVPSAPPEWAYAGLMVVLMFCYILSRLPFAYSSILGVVMIVYHNVVSYGILHDTVRELWLADSFLVSIAVIGMAAAYGLERNTRLVFLRERQLDRARRRADDAAPQHAAGLDRRPVPGGGHAAGGGADRRPPRERDRALRRPGQVHGACVATSHPHELVVVLDDVFTRFDELADRVGMEKIKTVGDAYMAVAGAPDPRPDHADAGARWRSRSMAMPRGGTMADG